MTPIEDKFNALLFSGLNLGSPLGGEQTLPDGGTFQPYEFGVIFFHPRVGEAFECHGLILQTYMDLGGVMSGLGYPITDEIDNPEVPGGRMSIFEFGQMVWELSTGVSEQFDSWDIVSQVVVKLEDQIPISLSPGETLSLEQLEGLLGFFLGSTLVTDLRSLFPNLEFRRLFDPLSGQDIQELVDRAQSQDPGYTPPKFENYLVIDCPPDVNKDMLVSTLKQGIGIVETAYISLVLEDPAVVGTSNPFFDQQGYLGAINGINAPAAWAKGADGSGTQFIDIEQGWFLGHRDLPQGIPVLEGQNHRPNFAHGCAVLGIIVGIDNNRGIVGIAPQAGAALISRMDRRGNALLADQTAAMILRAALLLGFGDIILLEMTAGGGPVEIIQPMFDAIRLATTVGVVVVEAAGNRARDLDSLLDERGRHVLARNNPAEFRESGAIIVGAGSSNFPHVRLDRSSFGSRVDCYAWGENIVTTGDRQNNSTNPDAIMNNMSGTSGASAIIAGVCLLMQDLQLRLQPVAGLPLKLPPLALRRILSKPENGTPSFLVSDQIGVQPDFQKIIDNEFEIPIL